MKTQFIKYNTDHVSNSFFILAIGILLCLLPGCKSPITTEIVLEKPTAEQQKEFEKYSDLITQRAKKSGIAVKSNSVNVTDGRIHMTFRGGDPSLIEQLLFSESLKFNLMQVVDSKEIWEFMNNLDLSDISYDSSSQLQNRIDSTSAFLKVNLDFTSQAIFGFAMISDTNYAGKIMDSLLTDYFGVDYYKVAWGIPFINDSLTIPLYILKVNPNNPFENNDQFVLYSSVSKNSRNGLPELNLKFRRNYVDAWSRMTAASEGQFIAILLNKKVCVAPKVNEQINNGSCTISANFSDEEAKMIAGILTCENLPYELKIISVKAE